MEMLIRAICLVGGYGVGLIQTAYIYGRIKGVDIRKYGSGNAGTTNALRVLGKKAGLIVFLGDFLKGIIACSLTHIILGQLGIGNAYMFVLYTGLGVVLGHNFPFYMQFKGGKGIAASVGFLLAFDWRLFVLCAVVFFVIFALTHYVSLCSLTAYLVALIALIVRGEHGGYGMDPSHTLEMYVVMAFLTCLAFWRHRANIVRLAHGKENKVFLGKSKKG